MASTVSTAAAEESTERRQLQRNGRKPEMSSEVGEKVAEVMSSDAARKRSVDFLRVLQAALPCLTGAEQISMLEVRCAGRGSEAFASSICFELCS